jgi:hypothetical protein
MRTRTKGIQLLEDGERSVDKQYHGQRIYERLGKVSQEDAEAWLRQREAQIDASRTDKLREGDEQLFAAAAAKYLTECQQRQVRSLQTISYHVQILRDVCNDSLEAFKDDRVADDKVKNAHRQPQSRSRPHGTQPCSASVADEWQAVAEQQPSHRDAGRIGPGPPTSTHQLGRASEPGGETTCPPATNGALHGEHRRPRRQRLRASVGVGSTGA